jgi:hypothetical protein
MLSIQECKKELNKNEERYTDAEVKEIREILYQLASIEFENYKGKIDEKESNHLCKGIDRRTGRKIS